MTKLTVPRGFQGDSEIPHPGNDDNAKERRPAGGSSSMAKGILHWKQIGFLAKRRSEFGDQLR